MNKACEILWDESHSKLYKWVYNNQGSMNQNREFTKVALTYAEKKYGREFAQNYQLFLKQKLYELSGV